MSAPPSPHRAHAALGDHSFKRNVHLPALELPDEDRNSRQGDELPNERNFGNASEPVQLDVRISIADESALADHEKVSSRSASATSSLDPYYFGIQSPSESPVPPLPSAIAHLRKTPEMRPLVEPTTPARNPAAIDRRGLVGVGELATPRWAKEERDDEGQNQYEVDSYDIILPQDGEDDEPDSPWTIEAVDGESSEKDESSHTKPPSRPLRSRPSIAEESGGEEILYPRKATSIHSESRQVSDISENSDLALPCSPPSAFTQPARKARKRTSDEFEMDQNGSLISKRGASAKEKGREEKISARKHRSLNVTSSSTISSREMKNKERRRESSGLTIISGNKSSTSKVADKHVRQTSVSSSSSHGDNHPSHRVHTTDFSHLPPSPSSTSIQHFLKQQANSNATSHTPPLHSASASKDNLQAHASPNVAHSLLRGTQEGWSGLDDEATAVALRKLDGLTGKTARARASIGSFGRPSSSSRPETPAGKLGNQWTSLSGSEGTKGKRGNMNTKDAPHAKENDTSREAQVVPETFVAATSGDEISTISSQEKTPKKVVNTSARLSFTAKRGSGSSTTYTSTPTTSSRDSASVSAATSVTSISAASGRHSISKNRRNSAGSDISIHSGEATLLKDRVASLANSSDAAEDTVVPPVPPLPKDLSSYRSPPQTSSGFTFPSSVENDPERSYSLDLLSPQTREQIKQTHSSALHSETSVDQPVILKTPSKKWSFSSALNLKLSSSPSSSSKGFPLSPRSVTFGQQLRKSTSKDRTISAVSKAPWSPKQPDAMMSAGSLASLSSVGSIRTPALPSTQSKTPDRGLVASRPDTGSSASTNHTTSALSAPQPGPLSPTSSIRRGQSKRLTPSSIPFFRRSSSQSMQVHPFVPGPSSPSASNASTSNARLRAGSPTRDYASLSTSVPGSTYKKSSVLSLGLPSLLKSSSRRSLHVDSKEANKDTSKLREVLKDSDREKGKSDKEKSKQSDKDRSESRISVLINRKRGKTLSSADPRKPRSPINLPPMQIAAIEPATAQRVAKLKSSSSSSANMSTSTRTPSSRITSQTVSSMQKQSDTSLRTRNQLPTIAGSPSVGTNGTSSSQTLKEMKEASLSLANSVPGLSKETPTKIPRISSRTSAASSPPLKHSSSVLASRRTSVNFVGVPSTNPSPTGVLTNEFGVMGNEDSQTLKSVSSKHLSVRESPPALTSRVARQTSANASTSSGIMHRKSNRDSISFIGLRKSSTSSVASISTPAISTESSSHHRFSALSPSKGLKLLGSKNSMPSTRSLNTAGQNIHQALGSPSSSRQSLSTPSPAPSSVDEEELLGDEEMLHYIRRQQAKKLASGATQEELDELLKFPEPSSPVRPSSPAGVLSSSQVQYLSEYEQKEILEFDKIYCIGAKSKKKQAILRDPTNNYGYDDERGDYLVVNNDHLAYRYEVVDTLGKGSFGQVLHCRDHGTGESVAIKIIRNKKRFHHQALVEIKILDNLRKWDAEEKHHVIKMTEHFYFRNHLCIAMELLSINLYELIKANGFVGFTTALIRRFTSQMLMSLSLMRHHRIVHCDLKPENVLLRHPAKSAIKVIDFGSSCFEHEKIYTYIQSRFYRSPEVILGMNYHMAIDMWSLGCILAELYTGFPIFPGENEQEQLSCIMEVLGIPEKEFVNRSSRKKLFFDANGAPRTVINSKGRRRRPGTKTLAQVLRCNDEEFVDFISKCLVWDPERRIKPQAAMRHPFVTAGRRQKSATISSKSAPSSSSLGGSRSKQVIDTPKKSLISAPTPLTARSSRTLNGGPATPSNSHILHSTSLTSSRSYRASQSATYSSNRTLNGFASATTK